MADYVAKTMGRDGSASNMHSLASPHEGLHRTLAKLKSLSQLPPTIVYLGGTEELYEIPFAWKNQNAYKTFFTNLKIYRNEYAQNAIHFWPEITRFLFRELPVTTLKSQITQAQLAGIHDQRLQQIRELSIELFQLELEDLISYVKENQKRLVLVTFPIKGVQLPHKICPNTTHEKLISLQQYIFSLLEQQNYTEANKQIQEILPLSPSNPLTHYLAGMIFYYQGQRSLAWKHFLAAATFDCEPSRPYPIYNVIMRRLAQQHQVLLIDWEELMEQQMEDAGTFQDNLFPSAEMTKLFVDTLNKAIK